MSSDFPETFGGLLDVETRPVMAHWKAMNVYFLKILIFLKTGHYKSIKN